MEHLRECKIILPVPAPAAHNWLRAALIDNFGGYTATDGTGAWRDDNGQIILEPVTTYNVAIRQSHAEEDNAAAQRLAGGACRAAGQQCVYFRDIHGNVLLIGPDNV